MTKSDALKVKRSRARAKKLIEQIVKVLNEDRYIVVAGGSSDDDNVSGGRALWDILAALRGPDDDNIVLKHQTTARVRAAIGMKTDNAGGAIVSGSNPPPSTDSHGTGSAIRSKFPYSGSHFTYHYGSAVRALTLLGFLGE